MKIAILLAFVTTLLVQQPTVDNARLETRALSGTLAAELSRIGAGPFWAAYSEPIVAGQHGEMCSWNRNGYDDSGRTPGSPMRLEGEIALVVLIRVENSQADQLRVTSPDCHLDAGGLPFYWLSNVPATESIAWLKTQAAGARGETAVMAISLHQSGVAVQALDDLTQPTQLVEVRKRAAMWLGNSRGVQATAILKRVLATDPPFSQKDAVKYPEFAKSLGKISKVIAEALATAPPDIDHPSRGDLWSMFQTGRALRNLGKRDMYRVLRWGPMAVADLVAEYFETELLRAVIAARGIFGTFLGPWSAGSSLQLLIRAAGDSHPAGSSVFAAGGMGAVTQAMASAAKAAGAEIRTGAEVIEIRVKDGAATAVILSTGEEISAKAVISNADPKRTLLKLTDPTHLSPDFVQKLQHYRGNGTVAKVNLALAGLPTFTALKGSDGAALKGRIHIGPEIDYLERAFDESKYGNFSRAPYLEIAIPSLTDPALAPEGKHVMSIYMQYAPYKLKGNWDDQRNALGQTVVQTLAQYAPDLPEKILTHQIITPKDLEEIYGLTGGQIFHGDLALDQFFTMRPLLDWARYKTPIENLYLCGSGTHPGAGLTGGSGANAAREILRELKK